MDYAGILGPDKLKNNLSLLQRITGIMGGHGIKKTEKVNRALLAKWMWRFAQNNWALCQTIIGEKNGLDSKVCGKAYGYIKRNCGQITPFTGVGPGESDSGLIVGPVKGPWLNNSLSFVK